MITNTFASAVITGDLIEGAIGLSMFLMGVCAVLFPCLFVRSPYGRVSAWKALGWRLTGFIWIAVGLSIFATRYQADGTLLKTLFPPAKSGGSGR